MEQFQKYQNNARVWLYQTDRPLNDVEVAMVNEKLAVFVKEWAAHGTKLVGDAHVLNPCFVAFVVDENYASASGCSIDSSVKFLKALGTDLNIDFFSRMKVCLQLETIQHVSIHELNSYAPETLIYDPLVSNLGELRTNWLRPLKESSLARLVS